MEGKKVMALAPYSEHTAGDAAGQTGTPLLRRLIWAGVAATLALSGAALAQDAPADNADLDGGELAEDAPERVFGGSPVRIADYPWQVGLVRAGSPPSNGLICGGSLIADRYVLTAAHCVVLAGMRIEPENMVVYYGSADLNGDGRTTAINRIFVHEGYLSHELGVDDIAILELAQPIDAPTVQLATPQSEPLLLENADRAVVTGWGRADRRQPGLFGRVIGSAANGAPNHPGSTGASTFTGTQQQNPIYLPTQLLAAAVPVVSNAECARDHGAASFPNTVVCAGDPATHRDSCNGDSGGPLQIRDDNGIYTQVGVVSWGTNDDSGACGINYGVYTRVSAYTDWIDAITNNQVRYNDNDHRVNIGPPNFEVVDLLTDFQPDPMQWEAVAGGGELAEFVRADCFGFIDMVPDFTVNFQAGQWPLYFSVASPADTTIVVLSPSGEVYCNDDWNPDVNFNAAVEFARPESGTYHVWLGTFEPVEGDFPPATFTISEIAPF